MVPVLTVIFFITAMLYASVGFGGGSTYNAVLLISGADYRIVPLIALACNILVVSGNTVRYALNGHLKWRALVPALSLSIPFAWLGGRIPISELAFSALLGVVLFLTGVSMLVQKRWEQPPENAAPRRNLLLIPIGGAVGFVAGLAGIGGGIFLAPVLYWMKWSNEKAIAAACSLFILLNSFSGIAGQATKLGDLGVLHLVMPYLWLLPAVVVGGWIGNRFGVFRMRPTDLRRGTAILILIVSVRLLIKVWRAF